MKRSWVLGLVLFLTIFAFTDAAETYRDDYLIVRFLEEGTSAGADAARAAVVEDAGGGTIEKTYTIVPGLCLVRLPEGTDVLTANASFSSTQGVRYSEPDYVGQWAATPNDTRFGELWGMENTGQAGGLEGADIGAVEAWDISTGSDQVIVAVLDSGLDVTHPDIVGNLWVNTAEENGVPGVDDDNNGYIDDIHGYDFGNDDATLEDIVEHGTHVCGTVGAVGDNSMGVAGVCWDVSIMMCKLGEVPSNAAAIEALQYSLSFGAKVTNNSYGIPFSAALRDAIEAAGQDGQLFVVSAGNDNQDADAVPHYPMGYDVDTIISVLATDRSDTMSFFSTYGATTVDLGAPGSDILSCIPGGGYDFYNGTSMASPHVTGACALVWSVNESLTALEVKDILMQSVDPLQSLDGLCLTGGRLNLATAVSSAVVAEGALTPDPMQWEDKPQATGRNSIYMKAATVRGASEVEYFFDCVNVPADNDPNYDSGWQDSPVYFENIYAEGSTYQFQVMARDKSGILTETEFSEIAEATTTPDIDNLPPAPNPTRWASAPREVSLYRQRYIAMEVVESFDENEVEYFFDCIYAADDQGVEIDSSAYDSGWVTSSAYSVKVVQATDYEYVFRAFARQKNTDPNDTSGQTYITDPTPTLGTSTGTNPRTLEVPYPYNSIQSAIDSANDGDTVVVQPGTYNYENIDFNGKAITVRSVNPSDPAIVAGTILDPSENGRGGFDRAFIFQSGEGRDSVIDGFTIQNAEAYDPTAPGQGSGPDGEDAFGGAIACLNGSSPTISNCVIRESYAWGQDGRDGNDGQPVGNGDDGDDNETEVPEPVEAGDGENGAPGFPGPNDDPNALNGGDGVNGPDGNDGENGGHGGHGYGGAIYCGELSSPLIINCQIENCYARGGDGGAGGDGTDGGNGGNGGDGTDGGDGGDGGAGSDGVGGGNGGDGGNGGQGGQGGDGGVGGDGGYGGNGGNGFGGAIYFGNDSHPDIINTQIDGCYVLVGLGNAGGQAGDGGDAGDGGVGGTGGAAGTGTDGGIDGVEGEPGVSGDGGVGGDGGIGGNSGHDGGGREGAWSDSLRTFNGVVYAGAIYADPNCVITMTDSVISNNYSTFERAERDSVILYGGGAGGDGGDGGLGGTGGPSDDGADGPGGNGGDGGTNGGINPDIVGGVAGIGGDGGNGGNAANAAGGNGGNGGQGPSSGGAGGDGTPPGSNGSDAIVNSLYPVSGWGGAILLRDNTILTAVNCEFDSNSGEDSGGCIYSQVNTVTTFTGCTFNANESAGYGGAIGYYYPNSASFTNCSFIENIARTGQHFSGGGAIGYNESGVSGSLDITDCVFTGNEATSASGGAISLTNPSLMSIHIEGSQFTSNTSLNGGAILLHDSASMADLHIEDCDFTSNTSFEGGGVIDEIYYLGGYGGAISVFRTMLTVTQCNFVSNGSEFGGAIYSAESDVLISNSNFLQNTADNTNLAGSGGALYCLSESVRAYDCTFIENEARYSGGSVYIIGPFDYIPGGTQDFVNCLMTRNTAGLNGGAFAAMNGAEPYLINSTLYANSVEDSFGYGGGVSCGYEYVNINETFTLETLVFFENSILWGNEGALGSQASLGDPLSVYDPNVFCDLILHHTNIQGGFEAIFYGDPIENMLAFDWGENTVIDEDPLLTQAGPGLDSTAYLGLVEAGQLGNSSARNAGTNFGYLSWLYYGGLEFSPDDLADILGLPGVTTRTDHRADTGTIDMGYHYDASMPVAEYLLTTQVIVPNLYPHGTLEVTTEPNNLEGSAPDSESYATYRFKQGTVVELSATPDEYYRVGYWTGSDNDPFVNNDLNNNVVTMTGAKTVQVEFELAVPTNRYVPGSYDTIADAVLAAHTGDSIILEPRPNDPYLIADGQGINFGGKDLIVTSMDPNDPVVVASTVIDCEGDRYTSKRAFIFESGETSNSIIQGITIRNAFTAVIGASGVINTGPWPWVTPDWDDTPPTPLPPDRALSGEDATGDSYGGAILIENGSSPIIRNCVFEACTVAGGVGGDGLDGVYPPGLTDVEDDLDSQSGGHAGTGSGNGYGGAIAIRSGANPTITNCEFKNNRATGGWGGIPGDAGTAYNGGRYGWGGDAGNAIGDGRGGAIFVGLGCDPIIFDCIFEGNSTQSGLASSGGAASPTGEEYPEPFDADPWADPVLRQGSDGFVITFGTMAGGALFFEQDAIFELKDCVFNGNDAPIGAAVYTDTNVTLTIENCDFSGHAGGAVFTSTEPTLLIHDSRFINNDANQISNGVAGAVTIGADAVSALITDSSFVENSSISDGGAIVSYSDLTVENCEFDNNAASSDGGALYAYGGPDPLLNTLVIDLQNCEFKGNTASGFGGAGFVRNVLLNAEDCRFIYNTAASGGALRLSLGELSMQRCMVVANDAVGVASGADGFGGGLHVIDAPFVISDTRFELNTSSVWGAAGGGLCVTGNQVYYDQSIDHCLFAKNRAKGKGGGIALLQYVNIEVNNSTLADNVSLNKRGGGVYLEYSSSVDLQNSIVSGNAGYGVYETPTCNSIADDSLFYGNTVLVKDENDRDVIAFADMFDTQTKDYYTGKTELEVGPDPNYTNILDADPEFTTGPWGAYYHDMVELGYHYPPAVGQEQFTLTALVVNDRRGSVEVTHPSGTFIPYAVAEVIAIPDPNYRVYRWTGTDDDGSYQPLNGVLMLEDRIVTVEFEGAGPKKLFVPGSYTTIDDAMEVARSGDRIILMPRPDQPYLITNPDGINFGGRRLIFTSTDPDDPEIVRNTVIDCQGDRYTSKRAFHFESGEGSDSVIQGITIRNAFTAVIGQSAVLDTGRWPWHDGTLDPATDPWDEDAPNPDPLPPFRALSGEDAIGDSYGGAILIEDGSSPLIYKCVFEDCTVAGGVGGDGAEGDYGPDLETDDDLDSQSGGHSGKGVGNGYGGAIAVRSGSSPQILSCQFINNRATGGWGGIPGNAGLSYNGGRWGWGGNDSTGLSYAQSYTEQLIAELEATGVILDEEDLITNDWANAGNGFGDGRGGAIFVEAECNPMISQCTFEDNYARPGYVNAGGTAGDGAAYPEPFDADEPPIAWGEDGARDGLTGVLTSNGTIAGGAVFFGENADSMIIDCDFIGNSAYQVVTVDDAESYTRGGAVYVETGAVVDVNECHFEDNIAGAVFTATNSALQLNNSTFINNSTVDFEETDLTAVIQTILTILEDGTIIESVIDTGTVGGAVTVDVFPAVPTQINNCVFIGNRTDTSGGAILANGDVEVNSSLFNANTAAIYGGAFYSYNEIPDPNWHTVRLQFDDCEFSGNVSEAGYGGAGYVRTAVLDMVDCFVVKNTAVSGGGIYAVTSDLDIQGLLLFGNEATGIQAGSHRTVTGEGFGGGISIVDGPFEIRNTRFEQNIARGVVGAGAGLCITGAQGYQQQDLVNCLFASNHSEHDGGGIACLLYVDLDLYNCTISNNISDFQQGGGIFVDPSSEVSLENSIVSGNTGYGIYEKMPVGSSIYIGGQSFADHTLFYGNVKLVDGVSVLADMFDAQANMDYTGKSELETQPEPGYTNVYDVNPSFVDGPFGSYYLNQNSKPPVDGGNKSAAEAGLDELTTDLADMPDTGQVDLGFHYYIPDPDLEKYRLTATVENNAGDVGVLEFDEFGNETLALQNEVEYYPGKIVDLTAILDTAYFLTGWSGGTINDNSREPENSVLMTRHKHIVVETRFRDTLSVGTSMDYDTLGDALDDAQDGDIIMIAPGDYTAASQFPSALNTITLDGKIVTITGSNPDDDAVVRSTVFRDVRFLLSNLDKETTIEGITFEQSRMSLENADPIIRNCVFTDCRFFQIQVVHEDDPIPGGADGYNQSTIFGGALIVVNSSPEILNCTFENNAVTGADGENGFAGNDTTPNGGDGGWPSPTYGGAVYCGLGSNPVFTGCTFIGNEVIAGNGGDGADFVTIDDVDYYGGRGGGWEYDDVMEAYLADNYEWNGWTTETPNNDDKYEYSFYFDYFEEFDFELWAEWFSWSEEYTSWENLLQTYTPDPYDALMDAWRYSAYGGAVYCELDSDATFRDCVFENNQTQGGLTGVGGDQPETIVPWPDRQLNMPTAGGAVFAASDCDLVFESCVFRNNLADTGTVALPHTYQVSFGGAVAYEYDCSVTFTSCEFSDNNAAVGGGLYGYQSMAEVADCNIVSNEAYFGAGAFFDDVKVSIINTVVHENIAQGPVGEMGEGAGIYAQVQDLEVRDSVFIDNEAEVSGGGLYLTGTVEEWADIFNCLFAYNTAGRDGAGASVNWWSRAAFGNCTFADNEGLGLFDGTGTKVSSSLGAGLSCSYQSIVDVYDSIFWANTADRGNSIYVGTSEEYERPSQLSVSYSTIEDYPSDLAIFLETGVDDPNVVQITAEDPLFVTLPGGSIYDNSILYYLDQQESPSVNNGSRMAFEAVSPSKPDGIPLSEYTTSIFNAKDGGLVDQGYHYRLSVVSGCATKDFVLSGQIDLEDWAVFAGEWLTLEACGELNNWCNGADLNKNYVVDIDDLVEFVPCWLAYDDTPPKPDPSRWDITPIEVLGTFDAIYMSAREHHDDWWPDSYIEYYFDCVEPPDGPDSGWQTSREFDPVGLAPNEYFYRVIARDGSGNETTPSEEARVTPGDSLDLPQAAWLVQPNQPVNALRVEMTAVAFADFGYLPLAPGYLIKYQFDELNNGTQNDRAYGTNTVYIDYNVLEGATYTYQVRMGLFYEPGDGTSTLVKEGAWSPAVGVTIAEIDIEPPFDPAYERDEILYPNWRDDPYFKAKHAATFPRAIVSAQFPGDYDHVVVAVPMQDAGVGGVEYKFNCYSGGSLYLPFTSEWQADPTWQIYVGGINRSLEWEIEVRDAVWNQSVNSDKMSIIN